jgi:hypothetical protein
MASDLRFLPETADEANFLAALAAARAAERSCNIWVWYSGLGFRGSHQTDPVPDPNPSDGSKGSEQFGQGKTFLLISLSCFSLGDDDPDVEAITALIPASLNTQPQCRTTPNGRAPVISFIVKGQMKGDRAVASRSRLLDGPELPGGEEME